MHKKPALIFLIILMGIMLMGRGDTVLGGQVPGNMVFVKGGTYLMGAVKVENDEEPVHQVTVSAFYIGKYEVTQEEWETVMGNNPSIFRGDRLPVDNIDWGMAIEFCNKKSEREGYTPCYTRRGDDIACNFEADGYRLPTEAEWEYAGRGGKKSCNYRYSGGDNPDEVAWHELNSGDKTQPVGTKKPNELGVYDMSGNIWEWCWDWYEGDYYKKSPAVDPKGPLNGKSRCYRGGGGPGGRIEWLRSTARYQLDPTFKSFDMGFRITKNTSGKKPGKPGDLVLVETGTFSMGSSDGGSGEKSAHPVTLNSFYIGKFELTQEEWCAVMGKNPSYWVGTKAPVDSITWYEAVQYCNKRSEKEGLTPCYTGSGDEIVCNFEADGYRLPTEAEWEYAGRGGALSANYLYSGSDNADEVGWYNENSTFKNEAVGRKKPNELGIYDMSGNMWEWCWDWFDREYYKISPAQNPRGALPGLRRVVRGGSTYNPGSFLVNTFRGSQKPNLNSTRLGLRLVRTAK